MVFCTVHIYMVSGCIERLHRFEQFTWCCDLGMLTCVFFMSKYVDPMKLHCDLLCVVSQINVSNVSYVPNIYSKSYMYISPKRSASQHPGF